MSDEPVMHVSYVCPYCTMTIKPPVRREDVHSWVEGRTRVYAHQRCVDRGEERKGVDNSGTMVATD